MITKQKTIYLLSVVLLMSFGSGCIDSLEVDLWGECYNIESTTFINFSYLEGSDYPPLYGEIPSQIGQLVNMTDLYLGGNELTVIPPEIGNLTNLQSLYLYGNNFTSIPSEIENLTGLTILDIGYNQIKKLPVELYSLNNLELLRLEHNELISISNDLCNLSECNIYINDNYICPPYPECLNEEVIGFQDISNCEALCDEETEVELWGECYNIEETTEINYSYVYLGEISPSIGDLTNLN